MGKGCKLGTPPPGKHVVKYILGELIGESFDDEPSYLCLLVLTNYSERWQESVTDIISKDPKKHL